MFKISKESGYTKIIAQGKIKHSDYVDTLIPELERISASGSVKIMVDMTMFDGIELKAMLDDLKTVIKYRKVFDKVVIVSDKRWVKICSCIFRFIILGHTLVVESEDAAIEWFDVTESKVVKQEQNKRHDMNKNELVQEIVKEADVTLIVAQAALDAFTHSVTQALKDGGNVTLVGFGTFQVKERSAREGRNPRTGETIQIAAAVVPSFKAGKGLKDAVNC
jgi:DNA-binding protein HU-beta